MKNLRRFRLYKLFSFLAFMLPFIISFILFSDLFINQKAMGKFTVYAYIALIFVAVAFKDKVLFCVKKNPTLSLSLVILITAIIMRAFLAQLIIISSAGAFGSILSALFEPVVSVYFCACYEMNGSVKRRVRSEDISHKEAWSLAFK